MTPGIADAWADAMGRACWQGGLALAVAWALTRALPKLPAAAKCWVWRLAYLKLFVSLAWAAPLELPVLRPVPERSPLSIEPLSRSDSGQIGGESFGVEPLPAAPPAARVRVVTVLLWAWAAGVILSAARLARGWRHACMLRRRGCAVNDVQLLECCESLCRRFGVRKPPRLMTADGLEGPLLLGPLRPVILLPAGAARLYTRDALRLMLGHELAHLRRGDLWWNWLPAAAEVLFFFHPLTWLASREWRLAQESACDEAAVRAAAATPAQFGRMLLDVLSLTPGLVNHPLAPPRSLPATAAAGVFEPRSSLNRRISAMRHFRTHLPTISFTRRVMIAAAVSVAAALTLIPWKLVAQTTGQDSQRTADTDDRADPAADAPPGAGGRREVFEERGFLTAPQVQLVLPQPGHVTAVHVKPGDQVKAGQVLVEVDSTELQIKLRAAAARLEQSRVERDRVRRMREQKNATDTEVALAELQGRGVEAELDLLEHQIKQTKVLAPFDGVVSDVIAIPGMRATTERHLATVVNPNKLTFDVHVPQWAVARMRVGQRVRVTVNTRPKRTYQAAISFISPTIRPGSQTAHVRAELIEGGGEVPSGMEATVRIELAGKAD